MPSLSRGLASHRSFVSLGGSHCVLSGMEVHTCNGRHRDVACVQLLAQPVTSTGLDAGPFGPVYVTDQSCHEFC